METRRLTDALADFQKLSLSAYLENWQGYWEFLQAVARDPGSVPTAYGRFASINVKNYQAVLDASVELTRSVFGDAAIAKAAEPAPEAPPEPQTKPVRELVFEGAAGETAARQFVVANKTTNALDVTFEISEFASDDMRKVRVDVDVVPASFALQPGEEKIVECRIPINESFSDGGNYHAILRAAGLPEMRMMLTVRKARSS